MTAVMVAGRDTAEALARLRAAAESMPGPADRHGCTDAERLALAQEALVLAGRLRTLAAHLVAEADAVEAARREHGTSTVTWLSDVARLTRAESARWLHEGERLLHFPRLRQAQSVGTVLPEQGRAIATVLERMPDGLEPGQLSRAESDMVGYAAQFDSHGLSRLARHLVDVVAPRAAEEAESRWLERQESSARRNRHLTLVPDGQGSLLIRGSLPLVEGALLAAQLDAIAALAHRRALDAADPVEPPVSLASRRADALLWLAEHAALHRDAPAHGGDRPRLVVTVTLASLRQGLGGAGALATGEGLTASEVRRLACDADVVPVVLGSESEPLDVGREQRVVPQGIRTALQARDRGCAFPGCDRPPTACHAHHLVPWWAGGSTSLQNLVLVCAHHHRVVEPTSQPPRHRWQIRLGAGGIPEVIPPVRVDREQRPRRHQRFRAPLRT